MPNVETRSVEVPPKELRFKRRIKLGASLRSLWRAREMIRALAERQLRARYKQALLGFAWALIPPVLMMLVLTFFVQRIVNIDTGVDSEGRPIPYPLFSYVALIPWAFFSSSVGQASGSLLGNKDLLNKVNCPREVFPLAGIIIATVDMLVALIVLVLLFIRYGFLPPITTLWVPVLFSVQAAFTLGVGLLVSALVVYVRDLRHAVPIVLQLGLFATPIAYGIDEIPRSLQVPYSFINPLGPVIDGYRRAVLHGQPPAWDLLIPGAITTVLLLALSFLIFKRLETGFADVA